MPSGLKILVVDDDPLIVDLLSTLLRLHGAEVATAADGAAGVALAEVIDPDVVLLDIMMPRMDGYEVCRTLKDRERPPRIVMVTAKTDPADELAALAVGADGYIRKPFDPKEILRAVGASSPPQEGLAASDVG